MILSIPTYTIQFRKISRSRKDLLSKTPPYEVQPWKGRIDSREWVVAQGPGWSLTLTENTRECLLTKRIRKHKIKAALRRLGEYMNNYEMNTATREWLEQTALGTGVVRLVDDLYARIFTQYGEICSLRQDAAHYKKHVKELEKERDGLHLQCDKLHAEVTRLTRLVRILQAESGYNP